jgi:hypothetical protein
MIIFIFGSIPAYEPEKPIEIPPHLAGTCAVGCLPPGLFEEIDGEEYCV